MKLLRAMLLLLAGAAFAQSGGPTPPSIPGPIVFKSSRVTFGSRGAFALDDAGRIWTRALEGGEWSLLGGGGLPFGEEAPTASLKIKEIHADSTGLVAIGEDGRIYDAEIEDAVAGKLQWNFRWGNPWRIGAEPIFLPKSKPYRAMTYCLLNREGFYQEDIDWNPHTIERIDTLWLLDDDGKRLRYNDPWLPKNDFEFVISTPGRGAVELISVASSASTLFGVDPQGNLYTRLIDFDTMGGNPAIAYSFHRKFRGYEPEGFWAVMRGKLPPWLDIRSLPAEEWKPQPRPPGKFTSRVGIVQTGKGNAARELRVEGVNAEGATGYWRKPIFAEAWEFVASGDALVGALVDVSADAAAVRSAAASSHRGLGTFVVPGERRRTAPAELVGFNMFHDPITLKVTLADGVKLEFDVYTRPDPWAWRADETKRLNAGLLIRDASLSSQRAKDAFRDLFGGVRATEIFLTASPEALRIETVPNARADGRAYRFDFEH